MDIERTKQFYRELKQSDLCGCAYCRNYVKEAAKAYPAVTAYLQTLGIDIAKPFETMPLELDEDGRMPYIGPQYLVFGAEAGFAAATVRDVNDVEVRLAQSHPGDDIQEPHFVIEIEPIFLPWTVEGTKADRRNEENDEEIPDRTVFVGLYFGADRLRRQGHVGR